MLSIVGSILVLGSVLGSFLMEGGSVLLLWHPSEFIIILGAALGAFLSSNPLKVVKQSFGAAIEAPAKSKLFSEYPRILADHYMIEFITDCLRLIVGGNLDPHELESLLEFELETHHKEAAEPGHAVQKVADALPGFGIVAAVLGIVNTMAAIEGADTATIGRKVGAALVGTFLGILVSYGFVGPIASAIEGRAHEEGKAFEVVKMALVASVRGYAPPVAVEFARKLLWSDVRPSFSDLENHLKGKKKEVVKEGVAA